MLTAVKYACSGHAAAYWCVLREVSLDAFITLRKFLSCSFTLFLILFSDSFPIHPSLLPSSLQFCHNSCNNLFVFFSCHCLPNLVILLPYFCVPRLILLVVNSLWSYSLSNLLFISFQLILFLLSCINLLFHYLSPHNLSPWIRESSLSARV